MKKLIRRTLKTTALLVFGLICLVGGAAISFKQAAVPQPAVKAAAAIVQDPQLMADASELGIDLSFVNISYNPSTAGETGLKDTMADFSAPNTIHVAPGLDHHSELIAVAHEYMHYRWTMKSPADITAAHTVFTEFYNNNAWIQQRTLPYVQNGCTGTCLDNEINSYACTEVPPYVFSDGFNAYCNAYIPNRETTLF